MTPILITFNLRSPDDQWVRAQIRGTAAEALDLQSVIVQDAGEAERLVNALALLKYRRRLPYGGSSRQSAVPLLATFAPTRPA